MNQGVKRRPLRGVALSCCLHTKRHQSGTQCSQSGHVGTPVSNRIRIGWVHVAREVGLAAGMFGRACEIERQNILGLPDENWTNADGSLCLMLRPCALFRIVDCSEVPLSMTPGASMFSGYVAREEEAHDFRQDMQEEIRTASRRIFASASSQADIARLRSLLAPAPDT